MDKKQQPKMKSNYKLITNKIEEEFYCNKNSFEDKLETEARKVFKELTQLTFSKKNTLSLKFLKQLIDENKISLSPSIKNFISVFKLTDQLKLGNKSLNEDSGYDFELEEKDFQELFTGQYIRDLLFQSKSYEKKRHYIEEYTKLYEIMGGNEKGLSKEALLNCLRESLKLAEGNNQTLTYDSLNKEVEEIISLFTNNKSDYIPLAEFVNIMTSD